MKPTLLVALCKRALDSAGGWAGFLVFALTYPLIALLIRLESPGPALYRQMRVGMTRRSRPRAKGAAYAGPERRRTDLGGRIFPIVKYRTMRLDAEANGPQLCQKGLDPRVTRLGKWLRALHIDEIPQFVNVVKGDMSFVGPRPERPHFTEKYGQTLPHYSDRTHLIRPGITGLAQILLGYDDSQESVVRKSHYDLSYRASYCSFSSWIKMEWWIIWNTFLYMAKKPQFEGETRDLITLKRAKLLPFQVRSAGSDGDENPRATVVAISFGHEARPVILASADPAGLAASLESLDFHGKPSPEVFIRPKQDFDLEDMGFLVRLAHKVKRHNGRICIRSASVNVRKMIREMHLDSVVEIQHDSASVRNFLTVDVECWFHAYNMRSIAPKHTWDGHPARIVQNMERLLELMRMHDTKATFFVLGWVADKFPEVVRMIDREGHEIGTHGYYHDMITEMTPSVFEADLRKSLEAIGRNTSQRIRGHRASNFSVVHSTLWALEILARNGIEYDSSIFPFARKRYGMADYPNRNPHMLHLSEGLSIKELPMSTMRMGGRVMPVAGGGYLRLYPHQVTERFIEKANLRGLPVMVYLHPWELDQKQERHFLGPLKTFQHYVNLDSTEWKLNRLMQRFDFSSINKTLQMPRLQSLMRRNPVQVSSLYASAPSAASTLFAPGLSESVPHIEAQPEAEERPEAQFAVPKGKPSAPRPGPGNLQEQDQLTSLLERRAG